MNSTDLLAHKSLSDKKNFFVVRWWLNGGNQRMNEIELFMHLVDSLLISFIEKSLKCH